MLRPYEKSIQIQDHGDFITVRKLYALHAVPPDLVGELRLVHDPETELAEEVRLVGETEYPFQANLPGLVNAGLHQLGADTFPPRLLRYRHRADLGQVFPDDVEGGGAEEQPFLFTDVEIPDRLVQLGKGAGKHVPPIGEMGEELLDLLDVLYLGLTQHGFPFLTFFPYGIGKSSRCKARKEQARGVPEVR